MRSWEEKEDLLLLEDSFERREKELSFFNHFPSRDKKFFHDDRADDEDS
jgi:hypothetical protein